MSNPLERLDVDRWRSHQGWLTAGFVLASGFILFFNLWGRSLENHGYLRYAEVAREIIRSGDWVVMRLNGEVYLNKPPLLFWLIAIPSSIQGSVTPFLARLPVTLSAWIGVVVVFLWGKRVYGTSLAGLISAGILLSSYQYFTQGRMAKTDALFCVLVLLVLYFFFLGYEKTSGSRFLCFGLSFFFMGLGTLTKGPFGLIVPFPPLALFLIKEGKARVLLERAFILGYVILLLTVLPWIILFIQRFGLDQSLAYLKAATYQSRSAPFYFYLYEIWGQFAPWSLLLPFLGFSLWKERSAAWRSPESLFLLWFLLLFIFLTLYKVRASRYFLPALPPLALMLGGRWKKKVAYFLLLFLLTVLFLQLRDWNWARKDLRYSPGKSLTTGIRPMLGGGPLYGYRLNIATLEELNFYLDPDTPVPHFKRPEDLLNRVAKGGKAFILMTQGELDALSGEKTLPILLAKGFVYKKERLVLAASP